MPSLCTTWHSRPVGRWGRWSKEWAKDDLDRLRFPEGLLFVFPIIKFAFVLALAMGIRWRQIGRLTSAALVLYFVPEVAFMPEPKTRSANTRRPW
jgi:hypothetical protein